MTENTQTGAPPTAIAGVYLLLWVTPQDGIATTAIKRSNGAWVLRYYDGAIHDGQCNYELPEKADPSSLIAWVSRELGYPVIFTSEKHPRWWVPQRFRDCGEATVYYIAPD